MKEPAQNSESKGQLSRIGMKTANIFLSMALHIKYSSYDSREFPPENHLLHALVSSLPVILASYNRRVVKLLSHVDSWHICAKAVQILSFLNIIFDSGPMMIYIQEDIMRFNRKQK